MSGRRRGRTFTSAAGNVPDRELDLASRGASGAPDRTLDATQNLARLVERAGPRP